VALYIGSRQQLDELLAELDWQDVTIDDWDDQSTTFSWNGGIYIVPESVCLSGELLKSLRPGGEDHPEHLELDS
jgi:hypothetical protein